MRLTAPMTGEDVINILNDSSYGYSRNRLSSEIFGFSLENDVSGATKYLQKELNCSEEAALQGVMYLFEKYSNTKIKPYVSNTPTVSCPYCKSINCTKIGVIGRSVSIGVFGLGSSKIGKQWHCNKCKSDF